MNGFNRPLIILGAPRSGTTLLYSIFSSHPEVWSLYRESEWLLRDVLGPESLQEDDKILPADFEPQVLERVRSALWRSSFNEQRLFPNLMSRTHTPGPWRSLRRWFFQLTTRAGRPASIRFVDKNPRFCVRVPWLETLFPDARYVFVARNPRANIASLIEGWQAPHRFETFELPETVEIGGFAGSHWNFLRPPGWRTRAQGAPLAEVCAFQYAEANKGALLGLERIPQGRVRRVSFERLVAAAPAEVRRLCDWLQLPFSGGLRRFTETLPPVNTVSTPSPRSWEKHRAAIDGVLPSVAQVASRLGYPVDE